MLAGAGAAVDARNSFAQVRREREREREGEREGGRERAIIRGCAGRPIRPT